jgi:uncharacterized RDD family membrane protein YckC
MYCVKCGNKVASDARFCNSCGASLGLPVGASQAPEYKLPASVEKRAMNFFFDTIVVKMILFGLSGALFGSFLSQYPNFVIWLSLGVAFFVYPLVMESLTGRTIGKYITKTKVVDFEGNIPKWRSIFVRTIARFIPFDFVSFCFRDNPVGWHDKLSKTYVVSKKFTAEDVKKIDTKKSENEGAVLVAVSVIGVPAFLVFVIGLVLYFGVKPLRNEGVEDKLRSAFSYMKLQADDYKTKHNGSYAGICDDSNIHQHFLDATKFVDEPTASYACFSSAEFWVAYSPLKLGGFACVDKDGVVPKLEKMPEDEATACPR